MKSNFPTYTDSQKIKEHVPMSISNRFISSTLIALVCLASNIPSSPAQANSQVDQNLKATLDRAGLNYSIIENGNFKLVYNLNSGRKHTVFIEPETNDFRGQMKIRRIYSFIPKFENSVSQETKKQLLQDSNAKKIGSWISIEPNFFQFTAKVDANLGPEDLKTITSWVAETGDEMEQKLFSEDLLQ